MKQILLINDVVGHSHVGMVAMMPILTYMGHQVYNLPTALVSNTLDYGRFNIMETTDYMRGALPVWHDLGFRFDAVCTGLMFSSEQARLIYNYCRQLRADGTIVFVDPIMGDGGHLYNGIGDEQVAMMRKMVSLADYTIPNYTEACFLSGTTFSDNGISLEEAYRMLDKIALLGAHNVLVTSALVDGQTCVVGRCESPSTASIGQVHAGGQYFKIDYEEIPVAFHGTGDIFSAILIGHVMNGDTLTESTAAAVDVVSRLISRNKEQKDLCLGIPVEKCLDLL